MILELTQDAKLAFLESLHYQTVRDIAVYSVRCYLNLVNLTLYTLRSTCFSAKEGIIEYYVRLFYKNQTVSTQNCHTDNDRASTNHIRHFIFA